MGLEQRLQRYMRQRPGLTREEATLTLFAQGAIDAFEVEELLKGDAEEAAAEQPATAEQ